MCGDASSKLVLLVSSQLFNPFHGGEKQLEDALSQAILINDRNQCQLHHRVNILHTLLFPPLARDGSQAGLCFLFWKRQDGLAGGGGTSPFFFLSFWSSLVISL